MQGGYGIDVSSHDDTEIYVVDIPSQDMCAVTGRGALGRCFTHYTFVALLCMKLGRV